MYEKLKASGDYIQSKTPNRNPKIGIILGSGLGGFVEKVEEQIILPYSEIPFFSKTTVEGHDGRLIIGKVNNVEVAILQGRVHAYEGHPMDEVVFPTRVLATIGVESLILTNAAGGINKTFDPGDLVVIDDHINMMGINPLVGPNISELGPRFPDMTRAYCEEIKSAISSAAEKVNYSIKSGVYVALLGPTYETPSEIRMLRTLGADMVGMSTVPESIAANHLGMRVGGISCITNMAAGIDGHKLDHSEVKEQALRVMEQFSLLLLETITILGRN